MPVRKHWTEIEWPNGVPSPRIKTVCAWCKALMQNGPEYPVSHGMCDSCAEKMNAALNGMCVTCHGVGEHKDGCVNDRPWAV